MTKDQEIYGHGQFSKRYQKTVKDYITWKLSVLENEFYLKLTEFERCHFHELKSESAVDQYAHTLLAEKL